MNTNTEDSSGSKTWDFFENEGHPALRRTPPPIHNILAFASPIDRDMAWVILNDLESRLSATESELATARATIARLEEYKALAGEMTAREDFIQAVGWFDAATALAACLWFDERFDALADKE